MPCEVRCPNPSCGRTTLLGEDPLGRIFRCPRCLTKLPTAGAPAVDSGWTNVLGHLPRRSSALPDMRKPEACPLDPMSRRALTLGHTSRGLPARVTPVRNGVGFESGEFFVGAFDAAGCRDRDAVAGVALGPEDSGEVCIDSFGLDETSSHDTSSSGMEDGHSWLRQRGTITSSYREVPARDPDRERLHRFRILGMLGEGRHATVYRAYDPLLKREVALKLPRRGAAPTPRALERFLGEARALARLRHPRIVPIYEAGRCGDQYYIAMALIEGRSLADSLAEGIPPCRRSAEIAADVAEALAYAHGLGIIHRDVKPANIRLDARGSAYLMDFGIAYRPDSGEMPAPPGTILGTPAYVAPEQARGVHAEILPASDQYSLGVVLYELLCGRPPFSGTASSVLVHAVHHEPPSLRSQAPGVPRALAAICEKALAKQPERRYLCCQALGDDLRRWLRGEPPLAHRRGWPGLIR